MARDGSRIREASWSASALFVVVTLGACRGLLGIEPLPSDAESTSDARADSADSASGADGAPDRDGDAAHVPDPAWASWRIPPDVGPRYEVSAGVAVDLVSGLTWQRVTGGPADWKESKTYCEGLTLGGRSGWRLPTRIELTSLVDYDRSLEGNPFSGVLLDPVCDCYWTISGETDQTSHWLLATFTGEMGVSVRDTSRCASRCIHGPPYDYATNVPPNYVVENGVVRDPLTRLEWQAVDGRGAGQDIAFEAAEQRCRDLRLLNQRDWRLPTVKELASLVDERRILPALDPRVVGEPDVYWSSTLHNPTTDGGAARLAWRLSFSDGSMIPADDSLAFSAGIALVRCVRNY